MQRYNNNGEDVVKEFLRGQSFITSRGREGGGGSEKFGVSKLYPQNNYIWNLCRGGGGGGGGGGSQTFGV